jgi:hypothetical protein
MVQMHKIVITSLPRKRKNPKFDCLRHHANVAVGDLVFVAAPAQVKLPKVMPRWTRHFCVNRTINEWVYQIQFLGQS